MLHVTGREPTGFHALQSLFAFTNVVDTLVLHPSTQTQVKIMGPFATSVSSQENSVLAAINWFSHQFPKCQQKWSVTLEKNIPVAAGLGGGTSDAAATIAALLQAYEINIKDIHAFVCASGELGADVPVCLTYQLGLGSLFWLEGSGKLHFPEPRQGKLSYPMILVNPLKPTPTGAVFHQLHGHYSSSILPYEEGRDLLTWVKEHRNDLERPASQLVPDIQNILEVLQKLPGCLLTRMSGAGATCFAFFEPSMDMTILTENLKNMHPQWWIMPSCLVE
jgi:4-diphosphocytidyl-2-C-methyl-D-erythritol kinase